MIRISIILTHKIAGRVITLLYVTCSTISYGRCIAALELPTYTIIKLFSYALYYISNM